MKLDVQKLDDRIRKLQALKASDRNLYRSLFTRKRITANWWRTWSVAWTCRQAAVCSGGEANDLRRAGEFSLPV
jgi:hypothetical protein